MRACRGFSRYALFVEKTRLPTVESAGAGRSVAVGPLEAFRGSWKSSSFDLSLGKTPSLESIHHVRRAKTARQHGCHCHDCLPQLFRPKLILFNVGNEQLGSWKLLYNVAFTLNDKIKNVMNFKSEHNKTRPILK